MALAPKHAGLTLGVKGPEAPWRSVGASTPPASMSYVPKFFMETGRTGSRHQGPTIVLMRGDTVVSEAVVVVTGDGKITTMQLREVEPEILVDQSTADAPKTVKSEDDD